MTILIRMIVSRSLSGGRNIKQELDKANVSVRKKPPTSRTLSPYSNPFSSQRNRRSEECRAEIRGRGAAVGVADFDRREVEMLISPPYEGSFAGMDVQVNLLGRTDHGKIFRMDQRIRRRDSSGDCSSSAGVYSPRRLRQNGSQDGAQRIRAVPGAFSARMGSRMSLSSTAGVRGISSWRGQAMSNFSGLAPGDKVVKWRRKSLRGRRSSSRTVYCEQPQVPGKKTGQGRAPTFPEEIDGYHRNSIRRPVRPGHRDSHVLQDFRVCREWGSRFFRESVPFVSVCSVHGAAGGYGNARY